MQKVFCFRSNHDIAPHCHCNPKEVLEITIQSDLCCTCVHDCMFTLLVILDPPEPQGMECVIACCPQLTRLTA